MARRRHTPEQIARKLKEADRMLIFGRRHLEHALARYVAHYTHHRPHRALDQQAPLSVRTSPASIGDPDLARMRKTDKLGGLIHEYQLAG